MSNPAGAFAPSIAASLSGLVAPAHLGLEAMARHAEQFSSHPARLIIVKDFLIPEVADRLAAFVSSEADYEARAGHFEGGLRQSKTSYQFQDGRVRLEAFSPNAAQFVALFAAFADGRMSRFLEQLVGCPLGEVDTCAPRKMRPGDFIQPHHDRDGERRLAWILHLTKTWRVEAGGTLLVVARSGESTSIPPMYNALVLFDVHAHKEHWVTAVAGPEERLTIGGWVRAGADALS